MTGLLLNKVTPRRGTKSESSPFWGETHRLAASPPRQPRRRRSAINPVRVPSHPRHPRVEEKQSSRNGGQFSVLAAVSL